MLQQTLLTAALLGLASAHICPWVPGMYCKNGADLSVANDPQTNLAVNPLYNHTQEEWWFQHHRGCDSAPPPAGEFLEIPANGEFTVELATNRAFTSLSFNGTQSSDWPDGEDHPEDWDSWNGSPDSPCVVTKSGQGPMHTYNESSSAGTAWAISYESDLSKVTMENLVVFSVLKHTPWKRMATYQVPDLPACPEEGCTCAWLWVPKGCGEPNM
jgi:hypothetical protein